MSWIVNSNLEGVIVSECIVNISFYVDSCSKYCVQKMHFLMVLISCLAGVRIKKVMGEVIFQLNCQYLFCINHSFVVENASMLLNIVISCNHPIVALLFAIFKIQIFAQRTFADDLMHVNCKFSWKYFSLKMYCTCKKYNTLVFFLVASLVGAVQLELCSFHIVTCCTRKIDLCTKNIHRHSS